MAKENGLGWTTFEIADASGTPQDIRDDVTELSFSMPRGVQDVTGIGVSAHERLLLLADLSYDISVVFDPGSDLEHEVFSTIPSTSVQRAISNVVNTKTLGPCNCLLTDYALTRSATGEFTAKVPAVLADGAVPTWS
jgi:hypothetical protein